MAGDKGSLAVVGPVQVVEIALDFQELRQTLGGALRLADENVGDRRSLNRTLPKKGTKAFRKLKFQSNFKALFCINLSLRPTKKLLESERA